MFGPKSACSPLEYSARLATSLHIYIFISLKTDRLCNKVISCAKAGPALPYLPIDNIFRFSFISPCEMRVHTISFILSSTTRTGQMDVSSSLHKMSCLNPRSTFTSGRKGGVQNNEANAAVERGKWIDWGYERCTET